MRTEFIRRIIVIRILIRRRASGSHECKVVI